MVVQDVIHSDLLPTRYYCGLLSCQRETAQCGLKGCVLDHSETLRDLRLAVPASWRVMDNIGNVSWIDLLGLQSQMATVHLEFTHDAFPKSFSVPS